MRYFALALGDWHGRVLNHTSVLKTINYSIEINTGPNVIMEKCIYLRLIVAKCRSNFLSFVG